MSAGRRARTATVDRSPARGAPGRRPGTWLRAWRPCGGDGDRADAELEQGAAGHDQQLTGPQRRGGSSGSGGPARQKRIAPASTSSPPASHSTAVTARRPASARCARTAARAPAAEAARRVPRAVGRHRPPAGRARRERRWRVRQGRGLGHGSLHSPVLVPRIMAGDSRVVTAAARSPAVAGVPAAPVARRRHRVGVRRRHRVPRRLRVGLRVPRRHLGLRGPGRPDDRAHQRGQREAAAHGGDDVPGAGVGVRVGVLPRGGDRRPELGRVVRLLGVDRVERDLDHIPTGRVPPRRTASRTS